VPKTTMNDRNTPLNSFRNLIIVPPISSFYNEKRAEKGGGLSGRLRRAVFTSKRVSGLRWLGNSGIMLRLLGQGHAQLFQLLFRNR
jgi:hypothetical protein